MENVLSDRPQILKFDIEKMAEAGDYPLESLQPVYYASNSLEHAQNEIEQFCGLISKR